MSFLKKTIKFSLYVTLILCTSGITYQMVYSYIDKWIYSPKTPRIDIGKTKYHVVQQGQKKTGTVVLESGLGCISSDWKLVQDEIAKFSYVLSYDRAGVGFSQSSLSERTLENMVSELHDILEKIKAPKPYILVGHSFGGCIVQLFAQKYSEDVKALILVDACHEDLFNKMPLEFFQSHINFMKNPWISYLGSTLGVKRLLCKLFFAKSLLSLPKDIGKVHLAMMSTTKHTIACNQEARLIAKSLDQLKHAGKNRIKDKPCYVISACRPYDLSSFGVSKKDEKLIDEIFGVWNSLQYDLSSQFVDCKHLFADKSDHMVIWHQPEIIVDAVQIFCNP